MDSLGGLKQANPVLFRQIRAFKVHACTHAHVCECTACSWTLAVLASASSVNGGKCTQGEILPWLSIYPGIREHPSAGTTLVTANKYCIPVFNLVDFRSGFCKAQAFVCTGLVCCSVGISNTWFVVQQGRCSEIIIMLCIYYSPTSRSAKLLKLNVPNLVLH